MDDSCISGLELSFSQNIDYMEKDVDLYDLYRCWRTNNSVSIKSQHQDICTVIPSTVSKRLENICWRRWYKDIKHLSVISPNDINWYKDQDITYLYGPKFNNGSSKFDLNGGTPRLTPENLARVEAMEVSSPTTGINEDDDAYLSSSPDWRVSDFDLDSSSMSSFETEVEEKKGSSGYESLKPAFKSKSKKHKKVKFNYVVNSREYVNGMSFDYSYLDQQCL